MSKNPYILDEPIFPDPGYFLTFQPDDTDNPTEVRLMNDYARMIQENFGHPNLFPPEVHVKYISDIYKYMVQNYLYVLQCILGSNQNDDTRFLILHYDFFFHQFGSILEKNKSENVVEDTKKLLQHLYFYMRDGDRYEINPIFEIQKNVTDLFIAFKDLYHGNPKKYLKLIDKY